MPSPFTASLLDGGTVSVGSSTFEYIQAYNLMNKEAPSGGSLIFTIEIVEISASLGAPIIINRLSGVVDFTSPDLTIEVYIDGILASHTVDDSNTVTTLIPGNATSGSNKLVELKVTTLGNTTTATDTINIVSGVDLTYISDGDQNGLIYYYGTDRNTTSFSNPSGTKLLTFQSSDIDGTRISSNATDRILSESHTGDVRGSWWCVSLEDGESLIINHLSVRSRNQSNGNHPQNWVLQGTLESVTSLNDVYGVFWDTLLTVTANPFTSTDEYKNFPISSGTEYRAFRILMTNVNTSSFHNLVLGNVELYGTLITHPTPPVDPSNPLIRISTEKSVPYISDIVSPTIKGSGSFLANAGSTRPTNTGLQNGKQTSGHSNGGFFDIVPNLQLSSGTSWTIIFTGKVFSDSIIVGSSSPNNQFRIYPSNNTTMYIYTGQSPKVAPQNLTTPTGTWGIWAVTFNTSQFEFFEWNNSTLESRGTVAQTPFSFFIDSVGGIFTIRNFNFGECEIYESVLNSTDLGTVALRLATTWGV